MPLTRLPLTTGVSGTLPIANGGTNVTTSADLANTGNLVFIKKITLSSNTKPIKFLDSDSDVTFDTTYNTYKFIGNLKYENDSRVSYIRVSQDGTNLDSTSGNYKFDDINVFDGNVSGGSDGSSSVWQLEDSGSGNATGENLAFEMTIFNSDFHYARMISIIHSIRTDAGAQMTVRGARYLQNARIKGISFFPNSSNNYLSGSTISMYGVKD